MKFFVDGQAFDCPDHGFFDACVEIGPNTILALASAPRTTIVAMDSYGRFAVEPGENYKCFQAVRGMTKGKAKTSRTAYHPSGYMIYCQQVRLQEEGRSLSMAEIGKRWREEPEEIRKEFNDYAIEQKKEQLASQAENVEHEQSPHEPKRRKLEKK